MPTMRSDRYNAAAGEGRLEVAVGSALINIADALPGHEKAYDRWYDEHFFSSGLMAPWVFSGRRWVAPQRLRDLQRGQGGDGAPRAGEGQFAAVCWIAPGHLDDYLAWAVGLAQRDDAELRSFVHRRLVFTAFVDHCVTLYRNDSVAGDVHALVEESGGLVIELIDATGADSRDSVIDWLRDHHVPAVLARASAFARRAMVFVPSGPSAAMRPALRDLQIRASAGGRRVVVLWFLDVDPEGSDLIAVEQMHLARPGQGRIAWLGGYRSRRPQGSALDAGLI